VGGAALQAPKDMLVALHKNVAASSLKLVGTHLCIRSPGCSFVPLLHHDGHVRPSHMLIRSRCRTLLTVLLPHAACHVACVPSLPPAACDVVHELFPIHKLLSRDPRSVVPAPTPSSTAVCL
jgi:hypothetical protein